MSNHLPHVLARQLCAWAILVILLTACDIPAPSLAPLATMAPIPTHPPQPATSVSVPTILPILTPEPKASLADRWLAGTPCQTPCWEQIIPGTTSVTEAEQRLGQLPDIRNLQQAPGRNNYPAIIAWQWAQDAQASGSIYYYAHKPPFADPPLNTVLSISLAFERPLPFQEVLNVYGNPSHVQLAAEYSHTLGLLYYFSIVYLDQGFLLQMRTTDFPTKPQLTPDMTFDYVTMFQPGTAGFDTALEPDFPVRQPSQFLVAWQGMQDGSNSYCREIRKDAPQKGCQ